MTVVIEASEVLRSTAREAGADEWLRELPDLLDDLCAAWDLTVVAQMVGGTESLVVEVMRSDGSPAVLKLLLPRTGHPMTELAGRHEATVLRLADGDGCARLLRSDTDRGALLLERLGPSLSELGLPLPQRLEVMCGAALRLWRRAPDARLPTGAEKAAWLAQTIASTWEELDRPCAERTVEHALWCADRRGRAHDDAHAVLVHGDIHQWNTLSSDRGFLLVDPDGLLAEPAYDLGILMREDPVELVADGPRARAEWLARRCGVDVEAIWEWGVVERTSNGLLAAAVDLQPDAEQILDAADVIARTWRS